jgi:hypothetical protein
MEKLTNQRNSEKICKEKFEENQKLFEASKFFSKGPKLQQSQKK